MNMLDYSTSALLRCLKEICQKLRKISSLNGLKHTRMNFKICGTNK